MLCILLKKASTSEMWSKVRGEIKQCIRRRPDENSVMELNAAEQKRGVNALASTTAACEVTYWYGSAAS